MSTQTTLQDIAYSERGGVPPKDTVALIEKLHERHEFEADAKVSFPWQWQYATVEELNDDEVRKFSWRGCDLCNSRGITHRKISDNNKSLLCQLCAEAYVRQALALQEKIGGENLGDNC